MEHKWIYILIFLQIIGIVVGLLYRQGIAVSKSIVAILFEFRPEKGADKAALDSCTGWVKHIGRFHGSRQYDFVLDAQLSKGSVEVLLLDKKKQQLMKMDRQSPTGRIALDAESRYYLRWEFKNATGKCQLHW